MTRLLDALGDTASAAPPPDRKPGPAEPTLPRPPASPSATRKLEEEPVHFVIPAGPGGATRPLGAVLSPREEDKVPDLEFILPNLKPVGAEPQKPAPAPVRLPPATGSVRLASTSSATPPDPKTATGHVRLTGSQTDAAKTAKHGTVRLTGNQTDAAKTAKHGTVRLTGNQAEATQTEKTPAPRQEDAGKTPLAKEEAAEAETANAVNLKSRTVKSSSPASLVVLLLLILVLLLYLGFFIVRPTFGTVRMPVSAPASPKGGRPSPAATVKPALPVEGRPSPAAATVKPAAPAEEQPPPTVATAEEASPTGGRSSPTAAATDGAGEVDVPEDEDAATAKAEVATEGVSTAAPPQEQPAQPPSGEAAPQSKFAPPWARKAPDPAEAKAPESQKEEEPVEVQQAVDIPEVREWPPLKVTAVIGSGKKGSVLVNGTVISVGEELEEGPVLKSVSRQAAVFEWDGDTRTIFVSSKSD